MHVTEFTTKVEDDEPTRFDELIDGKIVSLRYYGAGHIMGTCRMGDDPKQSVVDKFQRSHDHKNLYVVGSSAFPTGATDSARARFWCMKLTSTDEHGNKIIARDLRHGAIKEGDLKAATRWIERMLAGDGFAVGRPDGVFDARTTAAVKRFQQARGLTPTGQVDRATFAALEAVQLRERHHPREVSVGMASGRVLEMQRDLL